MRGQPDDRFEDPALDDASSEMVCGVCGESLVSVTWVETDVDTGEEVAVRWAHRSVFVDVEDEDHPVVPVRRSDTVTERLCDFCSGPAASWVLPVDDFGSGRHASSSDWAACEVCARLVRKDRWDRVVKRATTAMGAAHGVNPSDKDLVASTQALFFQVRENQNGPVRRT